MKEKVCINLVADVHHGPDTEMKQGSKALHLLDRFVKASNNLKADIAVDLGDRISDIDKNADYRREQEVGQVLGGLSMPWRSIVGNHDVANLTVLDNEEALGTSFLNNSVDIGGFHLVFWNAHTYIPFPEPSRGALYSDLEWLRKDLESTALPSVVFTHFPMVEASMAGNYYFSEHPEFSHDPNSGDLRRKLSQWGHVVLCVSGHVHWNALHSIDDIPFFSLHSLTETFTTPGRASEVWGTLTLGTDINIQTTGLLPMNLSLPLRPRKARWVAGNSKKREQNRQEESRDRYLRSATLPVRGVVLDLDGVVWKGSDLIPGSDLFIKSMRKEGMPIAIVTNNAGKTRDEYVAKLARFGLSFAPEDIFTAGYAAARWIARISPRSQVKIVGKEAIHKEFQDAGLKESDTPDYLVVSMDEALTVGELSDALQWLENGVRLVITNPDVTLPTSTGVRAECGAVRAFLETCCKTKGIVVGKPEPILFKMALEHMKSSIENAVMIGDTLETDIEGAFRMGMRSIRVETGNAGLPEPHIFPWKTLDCLKSAGEFLLEHNARHALNAQNEEKRDILEKLRPESTANLQHETLELPQRKNRFVSNY